MSRSAGETRDILPGSVLTRRPVATAVIVYAAVALAAAVAAYFAIFTLFAPYDDEGTVLLGLRAFAHGETLYRDVYSVYGPFYYELFGGFFALSGRAVTTDAGRLIVIVVWVGTSLLFGLAAQRLTGRLALGVVGMISAFAAIGALTNEPMHPQGLCVLLLAGFVLLAVWQPSRRIAWGGGAAGALLAALLLTKVNLGVFAIVAAVLAATWTVGSLHRRVWLRALVVAAFLAMPLFITARDLGLSWVRELLVLEALSAIAVLVAAAPLQPRQGDDERLLWRWLLAGVAGFGLAFVAILGIVVLTGPSPHDVYEGIVSQAFRVRDVLVFAFQPPASSLNWAVAAVAGAALTVRLRSGEAAAPRLWPALLRALAGLAIVFSVARIMPFGLDPTAGNQDVLAMVLAWVAAVPPRGVREPAQKRFLRILLPALALAETIQVYPVAGSQTAMAAVCFVPVGALCLADALGEMNAWGEARGAAAAQRLGAVLGVASIAIAGMFALDSVLMPAATNAVAYRHAEKLDLPGAGLVRLPAAEVDTYTGIVEALHRQGCTIFIGYPNVDSLYLWSGLPAPRPEPPNAWFKGLDASQQQRVVDELRASPRPCLVRSDERAKFYLAEAPPPNLPLVRYTLHDFRPVAHVGDFSLMVPREGQPAQAAPGPQAHP